MRRASDRRLRKARFDGSLFEGTNDPASWRVRARLWSEGQMGIPLQSDIVAVVALRGKGDQTRVLLGRRARPPATDQWCWMAGSMEPGEKAWQAALRELKEETGIGPNQLYSADVCEQFYDPVYSRI